MEVAEKTYQAYSQLDAARKQLAGVGG